MPFEGVSLDAGEAGFGGIDIDDEPVRGFAGVSLADGEDADRKPEGFGGIDIDDDRDGKVTLAQPEAVKALGEASRDRPTGNDLTVMWAGRPIKWSKVKEVAALNKTTPDAIMRMGTWQGRLESRLAKSAVGQGLLRAERGIGGLVGAGVSQASRAGLIPEEMSANYHRENKARGAFLDLIEEGGDIKDVLGERGNRIFNNATESLAKVAVVAPAGALAVYSTIGAETFDSSLIQAEESGLQGADAVFFAAKQAAVEVGLTVLMGKVAKSFGATSMEEAMLRPGMRAAATKLAEQVIPKSAMRAIAKRAGTAAIGVGSEGVEESFVAIFQQATEIDAGMRQDLSVGEILEAGATGLASAGAANSMRAVNDAVRRARPRIHETAKGVMAAEEALALQESPESLAEGPAKEAQEALTAEPATVREGLAKAEGDTKKAGAEGRGARNAKKFFEAATPGMLEAASKPLNRKEFQEATGLKKTSKPFRDAFRDTLNVYKRSLPPDAEQAPGVAPPASEGAPTTPDTQTPEGSQAASETPSEATPVSAGRAAMAAALNTDASMVIPTAEIEGALGRGVAGARRWLKRNLSSKGLRNKSIDEANDVLVGRVAADLKKASQLSKDLKRAVKVAFKGEKLSAETVQQLDAALKGEPNTLPAEVLAALKPMRAHVDSLSRQIIQARIGDEALQLTIDENMGTYVTRTFQKFEDRNWLTRVQEDEGLVNEGKAWLRQQFPEDTPEATDWRFNAMVDKHGAASTGAPGNLKADSKFLSILKARKDLPDIVKRLYGEFRDPWVNYTTSIAKMSQLVSSNEFAQTVRAAGKQLGFLSEESDDAPRPENFRAINTKDSPSLRGLEGMFATPETATALNDLFSPEFHSSVYRGFVKFSTFAKVGQTVLNTKTAARNFLGNVGFAMANGDLFRGDWKHAMQTTFDNVLNVGTAESKAYIQDAVRHGIIDSDLAVSELRAMAAELGDFDGPTSSGIAAKWRGAKKLAGSIYQAGDSVWKVLAWENKKAQYTKAFPDATTAEIKQMAADDVKNHYPTWSKVPKGVRSLSKFPFAASFVSFYSEMARATKNVVVSIGRDINSPNPVLREMAQARAVGLTSSMMLVPALSAMSRAMFDISDEEDEDVRKFVAPWNENSKFLYLGRGEQGKYDILDVSYMDPRSVLMKPITALLRPGDVGERVERAIGEAVTPFDEDLFFGRVFSVLRNRTPDDRPIWNAEASADVKAVAVADYLGKALIPGTVQQVDRIVKGVQGKVSRGGKPYDPVIESAALLGLRSTNVDVAQSLSFRNGDFSRAIGWTESGIRSMLTNRGTITPGEIDETYADFNGRRGEIINEWHESAMAAVRLGVPLTEVRRSVLIASDKTTLQEVFANKPLPYRPGDKTLETIVTRPNGHERIRQLRRLYHEALAQRN